jgi:hypothetical protein
MGDGVLVYFGYHALPEQQTRCNRCCQYANHRVRLAVPYPTCDCLAVQRPLQCNLQKDGYYRAINVAPGAAVRQPIQRSTFRRYCSDACRSADRGARPWTFELHHQI